MFKMLILGRSLISLQDSDSLAAHSTSYTVGASEEGLYEGAFLCIAFFRTL